jgi:cold shock CspA family protein
MTTQYGTIKWFSSRKRYGFITPENGDPDIFAHFSGLVLDPQSGIRLDGERVSYEVGHDDKREKPVATNIRDPNGNAILKEKRPRQPREPRKEGGETTGENAEGQRSKPKRRPRPSRRISDEQHDTERVLPEGIVAGHVKWFNNKRGYGFITPVGTSEEDVFVHHSAISADGFRTLRPNQAVEFKVATDANGKKMASDVTGPGGKPCKTRVFRTKKQEGEGESAPAPAKVETIVETQAPAAAKKSKKTDAPKAAAPEPTPAAAPVKEEKKQQKEKPAKKEEAVAAAPASTSAPAAQPKGKQAKKAGAGQ